MDGRPSSRRGRLARLGFGDVGRAEVLLDACPLPDALLDALAEAADPDEALLGLTRLTDADPSVPARLLADPVLTRRTVAVLGVSLALTDFLVRHPDRLARLAGGVEDRPTAGQLRAALLAACGADPAAPVPAATPGALVELRVAYRDALLGIAVRDLEGAPFEQTSADLAALADAALEAALAIARGEAPADAAACRLAVIAMGKTGAQELNYISDVDVVYVAEATDGTEESAALAAATRLATRLQTICSAPTPEGSLWEVDAALRPEGKAGALVRTPASHLAYYERWAKTWEFQALLKARPAAGDAELGRRHVDAVAPMVWQAANRTNFVEDVQAMRRRVEQNIPAKEVDRQLKLGRGGLRDVEFSVQLLQLVHGESDVYLRNPNTLLALEALATWGYVGREDASSLAADYRWLRTLEHRIQLHRLARSHLVPTDEPALRRLARGMGLPTAEELTAELDRHRRRVRQLHEKLFYRPLLNAVARLEPGEARLTPDAARARLEALGYADPAAALNHLEALTSGVSRRAAIQRTLLPVLLGWFAEYPDPDAGLLGFRRVSDALGSVPWYLALLRDAGAAERLARVLAVSRFATDLLLRSPDAVALLGDDEGHRPRGREALTAEALAGAARHADPVDGVAAVRAMRRRELFRTAAADILGAIDLAEVEQALTDITAATIRGGLAAAIASVEQERGEPLPTRIAVIAMGRLGGAELSYSSDADVVFVHDPLPDAEEKAAADAAHAVANELRRLLSAPSADPPLEIDADLRPEGRQGPLVRSLASYRAYYERWSVLWEAQALLRAEPVAGDVDLGRRFVALIDPIRYPAAGLSESDLRELRRIKARVETERMPRGVDPHSHLKLGPGGLADVEWTAQWLQLAHAAAVPGLRTTRTDLALAAAVDAGLLGGADVETLLTAWRLAMRVRNAATLVRGRGSDTLPSPGRDLAGTALLVGYPHHNAGELSEEVRRAARRARAVVERMLFG